MRSGPRNGAAWMMRIFFPGYKLRPAIRVTVPRPPSIRLIVATSPSFSSSNFNDVSRLALMTGLSPVIPGKGS